MKNKKEAKNLILRALQSADSSISFLEESQTITGYFGFTELDVTDYINYIQSELNIVITNDDIQKRMSTTIGDAVNFLIELTLSKNE